METLHTSSLLEVYKKLNSKKWKEVLVLALALALLICCSGCGNKADMLTKMAMGENFHVCMPSGTMYGRVESVQITDNVTNFGIDPAELHLDLFCLEDGTFVNAKECIDMDTGKLAKHMRFVRVTVTMTNEDATSRSIPENDNGIRDDSWYAFCIDDLHLCDLNHWMVNGIWDQIRNLGKFQTYSAIWYDGTGDYDPEIGGTSGENFYILRPGESLTYEMGFLVGDTRDDFSGLHLTNGSGYTYSAALDATYVPLNLAE